MVDVVQLSENWHLDKRIPLALIGAILIQTGTAVWWAGSVNQKVVSLESWQNESKNVAADIAVVKSQISDLKDILRRIEARMSQERD